MFIAHDPAPESMSTSARKIAVSIRDKSHVVGMWINLLPSTISLVSTGGYRALIL
jgi:hypothetical protein